MEPLQSQLSLRSLDVVEGRPSGTGRPSLPTLGGGEDAPNPFAGWLARGLAGGERTGGASLADRIERGVEDQVARRIRALDPAAGAKRRTETAVERRSPEAETRSETEREAGVRSRDTSRGEPESAGTRDREHEDGADATVARGVDAARNEPNEAPRALDGRERALAWSDASDAARADGAAPKPGVADGAPAAAPPSSKATLASAATIAGAASNAGSAPVVAAAGASAPATNAPAVHGPAHSAAPRSRETAAAPPSSASPHGPTAEELELAESVMRQLRARVSLGAREAVIELRPSELGRIDVRLRFEDGALTATLRAERPETLAVLEAHAPELRAWLAQDGAVVHELELGLADAGRFERPTEQRRGSQGRDPDAGRGRAVTGAEPRERAATPAATSGALTTSRDGIDLVA